MLRSNLRRAVVVGLTLLAAACEKRGAESGPGKPAPPPAVNEADAAALAALDPPYEDQVQFYTVKECLVCGMALGAAGGPVDVAQDGKLMRVCSKACREKLLQNPAPVMAARDSALIATQLASYPTDVCVVTEDKIEALGTPTNFLWGTRLIRLCCKTCEQQFRETPGDFLAALDAMKDVKAVEASGSPSAN